MTRIGGARKLGERMPSAVRIEGEIAYVELTQGKVAKVSVEDVAAVGSMKWSVTTTGYARASYKVGDVETTFFMHRVICGAKAGEHVDHIDGDKLNNSRPNLRICERYQNMANRGAQKNSASGAKGVSLCKQTNRWRAIITVKGKAHRLGRFERLEDAVAAYDAAAIRLLGDFAKPNRGTAI